MNLQHTFKALALVLLCAFAPLREASGAVWDTNNLFDAQYDEFGYEVNSNPIVHGITLTNYNGGPIVIGIGNSPIVPPNAWLFETNYGTGAGVTWGTNGHWQIIDQWHTTYQTRTNGQFAITQTNGASLSYSNGVLCVSQTNGPSLVYSNGIFSLTQPNGVTLGWTNGILSVTSNNISMTYNAVGNLAIISNGVPYGTMTASNLQGNVYGYQIINLTNALAPTNLPSFQGDVIAPGRSNLLVLTNIDATSFTATKVLVDPKGRVTNSAPLALTDLPALNLIGTNAGSSIFNIVTNGFEVWIAYQTNNNPGPAFTNYPWGTICTTTNGSAYVLSNMLWLQK